MRGEMSDTAEWYLQAARRASAQRRYAQAVEHFEGEGGGLLPASSESVVRYLAAYGAQLSNSTLLRTSRRWPSGTSSTASLTRPRPRGCAMSCVTFRRWILTNQAGRSAAVTDVGSLHRGFGRAADFRSVGGAVAITHQVSGAVVSLRELSDELNVAVGRFHY